MPIVRASGGKGPCKGDNWKYGEMCVFPLLLFGSVDIECIFFLQWGPLGR